MRLNNIKTLKGKRKYLRNNSTLSERILWQRLKESQISYKFRRQHSIGNYIADFYCPKLKLIIEVDGDGHEFSNNTKKDFLRSSYLKKLGLRIIRIKNDKIKQDSELVILKIKKIINIFTPPF